MRVAVWCILWCLHSTSALAFVVVRPTANSGSFRQHSRSRRLLRTATSMTTAVNGGPKEDYLAVHVFGEVTAGNEKDFATASHANAKNSVNEAGVARFDFLRGEADPSRFCLIEVYKDKDAPAAHKETAHYNTWRSTVQEWMAEPRSAKKYTPIFPPAAYWDIEASASESPSPLDATETPLLCVMVDVQVKEGYEEAFIQATRANCECSVREPGVSRFDLLRNNDDPCNFVLVEVYNNPEAPALHKETKHYQTWRETVQEMMARPRQSEKFITQFPSRVHWHRVEALTHKPLTEPLGFPGTFEFVSAGKIMFGKGCASKLPGIVKKAGKSRALIVTGSHGQDRHKHIIDSLTDEGISCAFMSIGKEPTVEDVRAGTQAARDAGCDTVISIGGGSAIDAGKAIASLLANGGDPLDYMEVIGKGMPITQPSVPFYALPTTSGTGSEVTKNAVLASLQHKQKASMRSELMLPTMAIVDPMLTVSAPCNVTASTGLDALTQCIEPYVSHLANPLTDALAKEGIKRAARSLRAAYRDPKDIAAREEMALASVLGGLSLANAKLGAVHGFAGVLGGLYPTAAHGAICAALLPFVFEMNVAALSDEYSRTQDPAVVRRLAKFTEVARIVTSESVTNQAWPDAHKTRNRQPSLCSIHPCVHRLTIPPCSCV